jgi:anti-sigma B factor antagonist
MWSARAQFARDTGDSTMALTLKDRDVEGITILDLDGRLVAGPETGDVRRKFSQLVEAGVKGAILNLKSVEFIDSTGLGVLVLGHSSMQSAGGALKLLHLSKRHLELLVISKLTTIFEIFDDEQAAINSFFPERQVAHFDILEFVKSQQEEPTHFGEGEEPTPEPA